MDALSLGPRRARKSGSARQTRGRRLTGGRGQTGVRPGSDRGQTTWQFLSRPSARRSLLGGILLAGRQFQSRDRRQRGDQPLQVAVHPRDVERDRVDLLRRAPRPLGRSPFLVQVGAHPVERVDDRLDALAELDAGQVAVQEFQRLFLVQRGAARLRELQQVGAEDGRERPAQAKSVTSTPSISVKRRQSFGRPR